MEVEMEMSSPLVVPSDFDVTMDIDCQGPLLEHVRHQEDGQESKLTAKVGKCNQLYIIFSKICSENSIL